MLASQFQQFLPGRERDFRDGQRNAARGMFGQPCLGLLDVLRRHPPAGGVGDREVAARTIRIKQADAVERLLTGHERGE